MKLYHMPGTCSLANLIVLHLIGAPHELVCLNLDTMKSPEGVALEIRRGVVDIEVSGMTAVLSWADENYRNEAAQPFANCFRSVSDGAIRLAP